jgi:hypothetical protein
MNADGSASGVCALHHIICMSFWCSAHRATGGLTFSHTWVHTPSTSPGKGKGAGRSYALGLPAEAEELFLSLLCALCACSGVSLPCIGRAAAKGNESPRVSERATASDRGTVCCVFYRALIAPRGSVRNRTWALTSSPLSAREPCCPPQVPRAVHRGTPAQRLHIERVFRVNELVSVVRAAVRSGARAIDVVVAEWVSAAARWSQDVCSLLNGLTFCLRQPTAARLITLSPHCQHSQ